MTDNPTVATVLPTRNRAASATDPENIAFRDKDDTWYPAKIKRQLQRLCASEFHTAIVCSGFAPMTPVGAYIPENLHSWAVRRERWKYISASNDEELYELSIDVKEQQTIIDLHSDVAEELNTVLASSCRNYSDDI